MLPYKISRPVDATLQCHRCGREGITVRLGSAYLSPRTVKRRFNEFILKFCPGEPFISRGKWICRHCEDEHHLNYPQGIPMHWERRRDPNHKGW